jgi:amino acid adenylation domain-containing protein
MKETASPETEILDELEQEFDEEEVYVFPASFGQRRLWFLDQFEPGSPYYNIPTAFRLKGPLNLDILIKAVNEIIRRHESIRTTFSSIDGEVVQIISPELHLEPPVIDLTDKEAEIREKEIIRLATEEARRPFDLAKGPLARITILKAAAQDHIVLLTMHHIISDGWSMGILVAEISALYSSFTSGKPSPLPELPLQYADYAEWQNEYLQGEVLQKQLDYWKNHLDSNPPVLELPIDRNRPATQTNVGASVSITISKEITDGLNALARKEGATIFMTLLTAFKTLLYRYTGQTDISVGTPIANRTRGEIEGIIGLFINTLVLRTQFDDNPSFRELIKKTRVTTLDAYDHQDLPFEYLVDALQPDRNMSYSPLFQVMFILQNTPVDIQNVGVDLQMQMVNVDMGTSTFDLTLSMSESVAGLSASVEFNTDLFDRSTVERLLHHFKNILISIISDPDQPVANIPFLSKAEEHKILIDWNNTAYERDRSVCIHELFQKRVLETPDAVAVVSLNDKLTYKELDQRANQLAHYIQKLNLGTEVVVGILHEKDVDLLTCVLGVLKAGGAYLPLDPDYPKDRLQYMLQDAQAPILLTHDSLKDAVYDYQGTIISIDGDWQVISKESTENVKSTVNAENLAYFIYTSGSTGKSKGTMVRHSGLVNVYLAWESAYELRTLARSHLQMASFSFDVFSGDWTRALCSGGKLVLAPRDLLLQADQLYEYMVREEVNIAEFVPAVLRNLIQYLEESNQKLDFFRNLIAGSDIWYVGEYKNFTSFTGPDTRLINSFGLTEATIDSSYFESRDMNLPVDRMVPIGKPFTNMTIYLLDNYLQPVPIGVRGELHVGGESLARGYFRKPGLTAERFIPNPFSNRDGERMYRTGDIARYLPDGNIEFLGRTDHQVKLRGFRIELGEIETVLANHEDIKDAAITMREDTPGDKRLIAYFVPHKGKEPTSTELRKHIGDHLPDYMTPSAFVWLDEMPLTPNGKVDRRSLPKPDQDLLIQNLDNEYVEPRNPTEEVIAGIFTKILNVDKVGALHNFFLLGGHSLLATQLVSRIKNNFKTEIPLRIVFETPTVAGLAQAVDIAKISKAGLEAPPITAVPRNQELPLSFAQQRLWFLDRLEPNSPFYNIPEAYRIKGPLKISILETSLNEIIRRQESLRTTFLTIDGQPIQKIESELHIKLDITDLSSLPKEKRENKILSIARDRSLQPIPLDSPPLFRIELLKITPNEHVVILIIHHIISDNWSTQVMMSEMAVIYNAFLRNEPSPLPKLPIQYADFAHWQRNWLQGCVLEEHLNYWKNQLSGAPPVLKLPTDRPRPAKQTFNGSYKTTTVSKQVSDGIKTLSKQEGVTLFMTLIAAFQTLLYRYSGQDDVSVGTPIANRNRAETEGLIGFFVNTLVLRSNLSGNPTFRDLLNQVRETALDAYAHQDLPFEKIVDILQPERTMSHSPLFQVMFTLQSGQAIDIQYKHSQLILSPIEAHSNTSKFDLTLFMTEDDNYLGGALEYNTDLFDDTTIAGMLEHFGILIESIVNNPDERIANLNMITDEEQNKLLVEWNGIDKKHKFDKDICRIFEQQAEQTPENIALEFEKNKLTYRELNQRINQLAHYLRSFGLNPDELVGVSIERSPEMIIAMLGVLKAGGAYVPVDPDYPQERLAYILEDSGITVLITQQHLIDKLPQHKAKTICLDSDWQKISKNKFSNPQYKLDPQNLAYMIYTSGSTGKPKGTMVTHQGLINYLNWTFYAYPLKEGRGSLVHSTIAFDATVTAVYTPLLTGKTITLIPDGSDLEALGNALREYKDFNIVKITPAHLDLLSGQIPAEEAAGLTKAFIIGGENLTAEQIAFWQKYAPDTLLFNEYGPTETVVGCVVYEALKCLGSVPIGKAIHNTRVYILDENLQIVPIGVPGELYIGGEGVARGYLNRPDLTAERFIPDPFSNKEGARIYKTGDLVRYLNDGNMIFIDRLDTQVKIRGYRIELGEIENAMQQHPQIDDAVLIAREDIPGDKRITAYFIPVHNQELPVKKIRTFLKKQLPDYMIPAAFVSLKTLPLTASGKVDRKALPKPDYARPQAEGEFVAPRTANEEILTGIWQDILNIERISIHDNFFELGGHSLLATQLMSRIRNSFGVELELRYLFESPTVSSLVLNIEEARLRAEGITAPPLKPVPREQVLPLSFAQQRLWFLDQLSPDNPFYNIPAAIRITGSLDVAALESGINEIIRRHEILRTIFASEKGHPHQVIKPELTIKFDIIDLAHLKAHQREKETQRLITEDALKPFKLDVGPLFRTSLIKTDKDDYIILFNMHHSISDGWSTGILMREIGALYDAFIKGLPSPLPDLKIQYADYSAWQRSWLKDKVLEKQLNYWKKDIGFNPPALDLPVDHPRPAMQTFNGDTLSFQLSKELSDGLTEISQKQGVTIFMTLMAAYQTLLHHYSNQDEIIVGSPIANRTHSETEELIGFFVNTLVLKSDFSGDPSFIELLKHVRKTTLGSYAHQDIPFEQLVDELQPERDMTHSPLFQAMFVLQNTPLGGGESNSMQFPSIRMEVLEADAKTAKFDLTLVMMEDKRGFLTEFEYNTDLFEKATIERMQNHFQTLLQNIVADPQQCISELSLIADEEKNLILRDWNKTQVDFPNNKCIHELFEERVAKTPNKTAVVFADKQLTFSKLNERANQLAYYLINLGVGPEKLVGISIERSIEMVVGLLGVLKAGGVYVPIDPAYPEDRIAYIIDDAEIDILLTQKSLSNLFPKESINKICLDSNWTVISSQSKENPANKTSAENLAYMIYTSGSTGRPKGTMLQHRGLCNLTMEQIKDFELDESSRTLQFASFSFDASVSDIFTTLISGATLYLAEKEELIPGPGLVNLLKDNKISVVTLPPSVSAVLQNEQFPDLKTLISAGEACPRDIAEKWSQERRFLNAYGPTENTVCASSFHVSEIPQRAAIPIGKPIGNVQLYILNKNLNPLPVGIPGELCIGGINLARGYFKQPDLTSKKFAPNPFCSSPGERIYRSGDLARFLPDGNIEFLGRIDQQVKIRGFRIELGEIEVLLNEHEDIADAMVMVREDSPGDQRLAAYYVSDQKNTPDIAALRNHLKNRLPDYMVPSAFVWLEAFPLTPNGKVDFRALPKPEKEHFEAKAVFVAPRTNEESQLADLWKEILNIDKIGIHDNFFGLGGHSLLATQLISRIRDVFGVDVELRYIFEAPTIAGFMIAIEQARVMNRGSDIPLKKISRNQDLPLSFAQQRLWFLDQLIPDSAFYNIPSAIRLRGPFDIIAFESSLNEIVKRHEILRTTFITRDSQPLQVIAPEMTVELDIFDLTQHDEDQKHSESKRLATEEAAEPFDLEIGPLFRAKVLKLANADHVILFTMHHIISDGWSINILVQEFAQFYDSISSGGQIDLPELPVQYADYAHWQRQWLKDEILERQIKHWKEEIGLNPAPIDLPLDYTRPAVQTFNGDTQSGIIPLELTQKIKNLSQRESATLFMTLLAAFQVLLQRYSNQDEILVGSPIANRTRSETEKLIGFFVNTLVFKSDFYDDTDFKTLLQRVRKSTLDAYAHQDLPFEQLVEILQPERNTSHSPIFQVMFVMQNMPMGAIQLSEISIEGVEAEQKIAKYDLSLIVLETENGLMLDFEYNTDLFKAETIKRMLDHFSSLLEMIAAHPEQPLSTLALMPESNIRKLTDEWNKTETAFPDNRCIHQLFEERVLKTPKAIVAVFNDQKVTFKELNEKVNQFAHFLRKKGVGRETIVGISIERSIEMVVALLGILKAGGVYLPVDPSYPADRIDYIIQDAGINLLITQQNLLDNLSDSIQIMYLDSEWNNINRNHAAA